MSTVTTFWYYATTILAYIISVVLDLKIADLVKDQTSYFQNIDIENQKGYTLFFGHASFYRRLINDLSNIARYLSHLLSQNMQFGLMQAYQTIFGTLKEMLITAPMQVITLLG